MRSPRGCVECTEGELRNGQSYYYYDMDFKKPVDFGDTEVNDNSFWREEFWWRGWEVRRWTLLRRGKNKPMAKGL